MKRQNELGGSRPHNRLRYAMRVAVPGVALVWLAACGGAPPPPPPAPAPAATAPAAPARIDTRIWHVMYEGIHSMTIFPEAGPIRAYNPEIVVDPYGGRSPHFSIFSRYTEREPYFAPLIREATSLEDLLARVAGLPGVEVIEDVNPAYRED